MEMLVQVLTPTLSLFFQEWFAISPAPDLLGNDWRRYLGAIVELVKVKSIAAAVSAQCRLDRRLYLYLCPW